MAGRIDPRALGDIFRRAATLRTEAPLRQRLLEEVFAQARPVEPPPPPAEAGPPALAADSAPPSEPAPSDPLAGPELTLEPVAAPPAGPLVRGGGEVMLQEFKRSLEDLFALSTEDARVVVEGSGEVEVRTASEELRELDIYSTAALDDQDLVDRLLRESGEIVFEGDLEEIESLLMETYERFQRGTGPGPERVPPATKRLGAVPILTGLGPLIPAPLPEPPPPLPGFGQPPASAASGAPGPAADPEELMRAFNYEELEEAPPLPRPATPTRRLPRQDLDLGDEDPHVPF